MSKSLLESNDDILTDNTKIAYCEQCETCGLWGNDPEDPFSNEYDKGYCDMFPYPDNAKPIGVVNNVEECPFYEKEE